MITRQKGYGGPWITEILNGGTGIRHMPRRVTDPDHRDERAVEHAVKPKQRRPKKP